MKPRQKTSKYPAYLLVFTAAYVPALLLGLYYLIMPTVQYASTPDFWIATILAIAPIIAAAYYRKSKGTRKDKIIISLIFIISLAFLYVALFSAAS